MQWNQEYFDAEKLESILDPPFISQDWNKWLLKQKTQSVWMADGGGRNSTIIQNKDDIQGQWGRNKYMI